MKILVIGGGGREHAWRGSWRKSPSASKSIATPGNPGIAQVATLPATRSRLYARARRGDRRRSDRRRPGSAAGRRRRRSTSARAACQSSDPQRERRASRRQQDHSQSTSFDADRHPHRALRHRRRSPTKRREALDQFRLPRRPQGRRPGRRQRRHHRPGSRRSRGRARSTPGPAGHRRIPARRGSQLHRALRRHATSSRSSPRRITSASSMATPGPTPAAWALIAIRDPHRRANAAKSSTRVIDPDGRCHRASPASSTPA